MIKIAQIGAGHDHAEAVAQTLALQSDIYDFVGYAVVDGDEAVYEKNRHKYKGIRQITVDEILNIPGLDAACIETDDRNLTKYALIAAQRGLHIHMDKPGSVSDEDFDRLIDTVKDKKAVFHTGYMYRYNPAVIKLKEDIASGRLGRIYSVDAQMNCNLPPQKRRLLGSYPGGMLYYLGCHLIDLVYSICGMPQEIIPLSTSVEDDSDGANDFAAAIFKYRGGISSVKSTAVEIGGFERRQLVVCGTKGTVEIKPLEWQTFAHDDIFTAQTTFVREAFDADWHKKGSCHETDVFGRYDAMMRAFADYVTGKKINSFGYEYERQLHKLILRACGKEID